ncbi:MAG: hypothetical protein H6719_17185 [Sandaracinaceae bacterium]|nr:hypothetical protein [Sandaracinaceae bacterium]
MRWWEDPKVARTLGRFTWVVMVAAFVVGTRFPTTDPLQRNIVPGVLVVAVSVMSFPTALGLYKTRSQSSLRAYRLLAVSLAVKILATFWVTWLLLR